MIQLNKKNTNKWSQRDGAVLVLTALMLPVLILFCAIAINLSQAQLARTQLKVSTDAAARAGGRQWALTHNFDEARTAARLAASLNRVQGSAVTLDDADIEFGNSVRPGVGRFVFTPNFRETALTSAVRVTASSKHAVLMTIKDISAFKYTVTSVASQVDRDIALVLDRSTSMAKFYDEDLLFDTITTLHNDPSNGISEADYVSAVADYDSVDVFRDMFFVDRVYSPSVLAHLSGDMLLYAQTLNSDYIPSTIGPRNSRWAALEIGIEEFFAVLEDSAGQEKVSVNSFATSSSQDFALSFDLNAAQTAAFAIRPAGSTAIGLGVEAGIASILQSDASRPSAIPTIVVMSDGQNKIDPSPISVVANILEDNPEVIVHAVTFAGGDEAEMAEIARLGSGIHIHAANETELKEAFRKIAESFTTVLTE